MGGGCADVNHSKLRQKKAVAIGHRF